MFSPYRDSKNIWEKVYHTLNQFVCPSIYSDWDCEKEDPEISLGKVLKKMKLLLAIFACEHILMCIPLFMLTYSISVRNRYLDEYFPQVDEEKHSTW